MSGPDVRAIATSDLPEDSFPAIRTEFRIHVAEEAFDRVTERGGEEADREVGGVLVGRLRRDESGPYVRIETTIDALHAEEKSTELTFTHETWAHVHEEMDAHHEGREIVGWYHTHPGFGVFLSDRDTFIHRSFFNLPHQIALVYDPKSREHGIFTWREGEPERCRRYWVGEAEQTYEPPARSRERTAEPEESSEASPRKREASSNEPPLDRFSLLFGAVVVLILGGLIGWWMGTRRAGEILAAQDVALAKAQAAGTQAAVDKLDRDLLEVIRRGVGGETQRRLVAGVNALGKALRDLGSPDEETRRKASSDLAAAYASLTSLRDAEVQSAAILEEILRQKTRLVDPRKTDSSVRVHGAVLGQVCADLAGDLRQRDPDRARRMLLLAIRVDPGNRERYQKGIDELSPPDEDGDGK